MDTQYLNAAAQARDPVDRYLDSIDLLDRKLQRMISSQRALADDFRRIAASLRALDEVR